MNYIILDLEATCDAPQKIEHEIIEIGAVKLVDEGLRCTSEYHGLVQPVMNPKLTDFCKNLTKIQQKDVDKAPTYRDALRLFQDWITLDDQPYWLCSWGFFDKRMFRDESRRRELDTRWLKKHISIKHQFADMYGLKKPFGMERALKLLNIKLKGQHHRALDDAKNVAQIFVEIFPNLKFVV